MKKTAILVGGLATLQLSCGTGLDPHAAYKTVAAAATCAQLAAAQAAWTGVKQLGVTSKSSDFLDASFDVAGAAVAAVGGTNGSLTTGSGASAGTYDMHVSRYSMAGERLWTRQIGSSTSTYTYGLAVAVDASSNTYAVGNTKAGIEGNTQVGTYDLFLIKYDSSGSKLWSQQIGVASSDTTPEAIAYDAVSDSIYIAGYTTGAIDGISIASGAQVLLVAKYNSSGTKQWIKTFGSAASAYSEGSGIAVDSAGNIYITGETNTTIGGTAPTGTKDQVLLKVDSNGALVWVKYLGVSTKATKGLSVAVDSSNNVYTTGYTTGSLPGNTLTGTQDVFVSKYDSSGNRQWIMQLGGSAATALGQKIAVDSSANVYVTGRTNASIGGVTATGTEAAFAAKYDTSGNLKWLRTLGVASKTTRGRSIFADCTSNIWVAGHTGGGLNGTTASGTSDGFLAHYDSDGNLK